MIVGSDISFIVKFFFLKFGVFEIINEWVKKLVMSSIFKLYIFCFYD